MVLLRYAVRAPLAADCGEIRPFWCCRTPGLRYTDLAPFTSVSCCGSHLQLIHNCELLLLLKQWEQGKEMAEVGPPGALAFLPSTVVSLWPRARSRSATMPTAGLCLLFMALTPDITFLQMALELAQQQAATQGGKRTAEPWQHQHDADGAGGHREDLEVCLHFPEEEKVASMHAERVSYLPTLHLPHPVLP